MTDVQAREEGYISLKDAAAISGYAPDYVGQLIRKGKLPGKQVYSNIAWMTTESALREYMAAAKEGRRSRPAQTENDVVPSVRRWFMRLRGELQAVTVFKSALYFVIALSALFSIFLFFTFAVAFNSWLTRRASERPIEVPELPPPAEQAIL